MQKSIVEALNRYEKHSLAGKRKIKPFFSQKMPAQKKILEQSAVERDYKAKHKIGLGREPLLCHEVSNPNRQNVSEIDSFNKFSFSQSQNNC